jgi:hypothetical protein
MPSPFILVRLAISEDNLHALLRAHPDRRRALRAVEWGTRRTETGHVLVTPPLTAPEAAPLREVLAAAEGVTEIDAVPEFTFGYTNAPAVYDGFGTLTLREENGERLVAICRQHLTWQASRYASGLHRFRPAEPPVPPAAPAGASPAPAAKAPVRPAFKAGGVVHFRKSPRRYVVASVETRPDGDLHELVALAGGMRGAHETDVEAREIVLDADQEVAFTGPSAGHLRGLYEAATRVVRLAS